MHSQKFFCYDCNQAFSVTVTEDEQEESSTACPYCGSKDTDEMVVEPISAKEAA